MLSTALDIGEIMLKSGAEISRVENTIERICRAYGALHVDVFSITSVIIAAIRMKGGEYSSQVRRIQVANNDLLRLEIFNNISRVVCSNTPPISDVDTMIREGLKKQAYPKPLRFSAASVATATFSIFFGGNLLDAFCAAIIGLIIFIINNSISIKINPTAKTAVNSFVCGSLSFISAALGIGANAEIIMIGTVILLLPGMAFGSAIRNLIWGDLLSGVLELLRAVIKAFMIALGYLASILLFKGSYSSNFESNPAFIQFMALLLGAAALSVLSNTPIRRLPFSLLGGISTYSVYLIFSSAGISPFVYSFAAAFTAMLYSEVIARVLRAPTTVFLLTAAVTIMPGRKLYFAMNSFLTGKAELSFHYFGEALKIGLGAACGIMCASILFSLTSEGVRNIKRTLLPKIAKNHEAD